MILEEHAAELTCLFCFPHSLEYDRTWCVVDLEGTHVPKLEAISGRRVRIAYRIYECATTRCTDNTHSVAFLIALVRRNILEHEIELYRCRS
jgi:hypothetical protein